MKIMYDYQIFWDQEYGGPSRYFINLAKHLTQTEEINICAPFYINNYLREIPKDIIYGLKISKLFPKNFPIKFKNSLINPIFESLNKKLSNRFCKKNNPDIVHKTYFKDGEKKNKPVVVTVYDLVHEKFFKEYNRDEFYRPKKEALESADKIICISNNTAKDLKEFYNIDNKKIETIYLGNSLKDNFKNTQNNQSMKKFEKDYLLFVGKRRGYKNFLNFLKAYSYSDNLKKNFIIICFGSMKFTKEEILEFKKLKLNQENIIHVNGDDKLLSEYYMNAKALIYPSLYEGFGLPILEAMSFNCPVICSNTGSIPEVGGEAVEYFDPYDIDAMSEKINKIVSDDSKLKNLIAKGQIHQKLFSWQKCSNQTLDLYKKLF